MSRIALSDWESGEEVKQASHENMNPKTTGKTKLLVVKPIDVTEKIMLRIKENFCLESGSFCISWIIQGPILLM